MKSLLKIICFYGHGQLLTFNKKLHQSMKYEMFSFPKFYRRRFTVILNFLRYLSIFNKIDSKLNKKSRYSLYYEKKLYLFKIVYCKELLKGQCVAAHIFRLK